MTNRKDEKRIAALVSAITAAVLPFFSSTDTVTESEEKSAKITGNKGHAEKRTKRTHETESEDFDYVVPVSERTRLRNEMVSDTGHCLILAKHKNFRVYASADGRAKLKADHLDYIGANLGDYLGIKRVEGLSKSGAPKYRVTVIDADEIPVPEGRARKVESAINGNGKGPKTPKVSSAVSSFFGGSSAESTKKKRKQGPPSKAQKAAREKFLNETRLVKCDVCENRTRIAEMVKVGEKTYRHPKCNKGAKYVAVEPNAEQRKREEKRARAGQNARRKAAK